ncbi:MAG: hypothetical protein ACJAR2_001808 [Ilumatobacter sp.]|jgi:hypothetical protein
MVVHVINTALRSIEPVDKALVEFSEVETHREDRTGAVGLDDRNDDCRESKQTPSSHQRVGGFFTLIIWKWIENTLPNRVGARIEFEPHGTPDFGEPRPFVGQQPGPRQPQARQPAVSACVGLELTAIGSELLQQRAEIPVLAAE